MWNFDDMCIVCDEVRNSHILNENVKREILVISLENVRIVPDQCIMYLILQLFTNWDVQFVVL